ncbi:hypothetical protein ACTYEO_04245 [Rhodophyticola sp. SM2404]
MLRTFSRIKLAIRSYTGPAPLDLRQAKPIEREKCRLLKGRTTTSRARPSISDRT